MNYGIVMDRGGMGAEESQRAPMMHHKQNDAHH